MMKQYWHKFLTFCSKPQTVFWFGMLITLIATSIEVFRGRNTNYFDYQDSTRMFWEGISCYDFEYAAAHEIYFLYTPVFSVLFAPIYLSPWWLGPYIWNVCNFCLFFLAIWTLPEKFKPYRVKTMWFLLSVLLQAIFCYQYNTVVAYIFIFAFSLLERGKGVWAVFLIMLSACTKVYGGAELALLFCYPKTWRNFAYAALFGVMFLLLPCLNPNFDNPLSLYQDMFQMIGGHHSDSDFIGILFARGLKWILLPNYRLVQASVLLLLAIGFFACHKRWKSLEFRTCCLAVISGYIILFSDCPETHTYLISFGGYCMAFWICNRRRWYDWVLFWLLVVNFCILPTDILCPAWLHEYIHQTFWLDVYTYALCWLRIIWWAVGPWQEDNHEGKTPVAPKAALAALLLLFVPVLSISAQKSRPSSLTYNVRGVQFTMKYVQGGSYTMGAMPGDTLADKDEFPRHKVIVNSFYMGETEVTQELWTAVMGKNRCKFRDNPLFPAEYMRYDQCVEFIEKLNALTHASFRIPTEAEWEYAARGGRKSRGSLYAGSNIPADVAWTVELCSENYVHRPVRQKRPNELGLYDMCGNVSEWCADYYHPYSSGTQINPLNTQSGWFRVVRGGAYTGKERYARITNRYMYDPRRKWNNLGLRLVMSARAWDKKRK